MTEAGYFSWIRSILRKKSTHWKPVRDCMLNARRESQSDNPRLKWEYQCDHCCDWFPAKLVEVDHIEDCGPLTCFEDIAGFVERLFCEIDKLRVLCKRCHDKKTFKR